VVIQGVSSPLAGESLGYVRPFTQLVSEIFLQDMRIVFLPRHDVYFLSAILRMRTPVDIQLKVSGNFRSDSV
jgi:hypothetical protein